MGQQHAVAQHPMAQQRRCPIEHDHMQHLRRHRVRQACGQLPNDVAHAAGVRHRRVVHQHPDVKIAVRTRLAPRTAAEQVA